ALPDLDHLSEVIAEGVNERRIEDGAGIGQELFDGRLDLGPAVRAARQFLRPAHRHRVPVTSGQGKENRDDEILPHVEYRQTRPEADSKTTAVGGRRSILPSSAVVAPSRRRFCRAALPQQIPGGVIAPPGGQAKPARTAPGEVVGGLRPPCPRGVVGSSPFAATPPVAALLVGFNPPARRWSRR